MSLPALFGTTLDSIPAQVPYLRAETARVQKWKQRLDAHPGMKIGICWRGNPAHKNDMNRSFAVDHFLELAGIPGIALFSLQKSPTDEERDWISGQPALTDLGSELDPEVDQFLDTAAVIRNLDLVITADTSVAHLAGALNQPVWVLLPYVPDWRWMRDRDDSPWYPSMRLFRQRRFGDWPEVFARVNRELQRRVP